VPSGSVPDNGKTEYGPKVSATGSTENEACRKAKDEASKIAPIGSYPRHCKCFDCRKR
jgi:hypothetical protein